MWLLERFGIGFALWLESSVCLPEERGLLFFPLCAFDRIPYALRSGFATPQPSDSQAVSWLSAPLHFGIDKLHLFVIYEEESFGGMWRNS